MFLITGATGNIGAELVQQLVGAGEGVRALVRGPASGLPAGAEAVVGDLNEPDSVAPALAGVQGVFLLSGYRDMPGLLDRIGEAGAARVVLLSGSSAYASDLNNPISRYMLSSEEAVRSAGVPSTILRPCAFMSNALAWAPQLRDGDVVRVTFADTARAVIDPYDIARVAAVALRSDRHYGRIYRLSGPQSLLQAEQVSVLGSVLGRELHTEAQPNEEARAEMNADMPADYVDAFFSFYVDGTLDESRVLPTVQEVTGVPPRTFEQWAMAHADTFR
jgi:uncharacterized protein YbjT (DUF2867 family)